MDAMELLAELMQIEYRLAMGRGAEYREVLADDALVIVPGAVLDKDACVAAMDDSPGWDQVAMESPRLVESENVAIVVYRFVGRRGDSDYAATLASSYRLPERRLLLHQQTPEDPSAHKHVPGPDEPSIPELEDDQTVAPRPEEEIADVLRARPDLDDHSRQD